MDESKADRIVDAHVHVWTSDEESYPFAPGVTKKDLWRPSFTPEQHFEYSRSVGAVRFNLVQMTWYGLDHSYILDLIAGDPTTYAGTGILDISDPEPDKTMLALSRKGCYAFRERTDAFDQPVMEKRFATGAEHNLALSFNMGGRPAARPGPNLYPLSGDTGHHRSRVPRRNWAARLHRGTDRRAAAVREAQEGHGQDRAISRTGQAHGPISRPATADRASGGCLRTGAVHVGERQRGADLDERPRH